MEEDFIVETTTRVKLRSWPSPQDYNEAVQTPFTTFSDEELKLGEPELNQLGTPRPRSGNFATVYKMQCKQNCWAVRCFLHDLPDYSERYQAIEQALKGMQSDITVGFAYQQNGISIRNRFHPILKMEWAAGVTLDEFVRMNLNSSARLEQLADRLKQLNLILREHGIAHGDLQHGNILVDVEGIKLVDYDGVFVPAFDGCQSTELGHRNYQHPNRIASHFNATLDNFSAWVIYVSLVCLSEDPELWNTLFGGDDCMLFRHADLIAPTHSHAFCVLEHHQSERIQLHARFLRSLLAQKLDDIPFLDANPNYAEALPDFEPDAWIPLGAAKAQAELGDDSQHDRWFEANELPASPGSSNTSVSASAFLQAASSPARSSSTAAAGSTTNQQTLGPKNTVLPGWIFGAFSFKGFVGLFLLLWSFGLFFAVINLNPSLRVDRLKRSADKASHAQVLHHQSRRLRYGNIVPTSPMPLTQSEVEGDKWVERGDEAKAGEATRFAIEEYQRAITEYDKPDNPKGRNLEKSAKCWRRIADCYSDYDNSVRAIRRAIELYKEAIKEYENGHLPKVEKSEELADCWHKIAHCYNDLDAREDAVPAIEQAIHFYQQTDDQENLAAAMKDKKDWTYKPEP